MRSRTRKTTTHLVQAIVTLAGVFACGNDEVSQPLAPGGSEASRGVERRSADVQTMAAWNVIALKTTLAGPFSPPRESRNLAIVSGAVNDAVCSIMRQCAVYAGRVPVSHDASVQAAVDAAARRTLVALYPPAAPSLDVSYDSAIATLPAGSARDAGVAAGEAAAAAMLAMRANDHSLDVVTYTPTPGLGSWIPTPPAFAPGLEPGWGLVTPFFMASGSQLRPPPPPVPGSVAAVRDYLEIVTVGAANSTTRTAEQSEVALFWISTGPQLWNQIAQEVTTVPGMNAAKAAHVYMLLNMAGADAIIAAWEAKYTYAQWRPVTAIRSTLDDGSAETVTDLTWSSFIPTPRFPDYPAGHATYAGAAETVLTALVGENPGTLSITSPTAGNVTHTYRSFHAIADEVSDARVWGGIHWRTSVVVGRAVGNKVGDVAMSSAVARGASDDR